MSNDARNVLKKLMEVEDGVNICRNEGKPQSLPCSSMMQLALKMKLLNEASTLGMARGFLETLGCLETQSELAYCGLASFVTVLNSLKVLFAGTIMLVEKQLLEDIKVKGVTVEELTEVIPKDKTSETSVDELRHAIVDVCSSIERSMIMSYSRQTLGQL
ncbi:hypothetical protein Cgig2_024127 [Carnegiea gigantea]|uniref:glutathione gamma-glutamylcysteinyltransferase n=1 Tax=Carnegiea gigantea TaxID=171969 RepID=A0A9Q1Q879_9CARY|nr:hypothetical protein Cgig2_024127 [Carnegiea gigantea]